VDGKVERNADGKEVRFPVILSYREKEIARRIGTYHPTIHSFVHHTKNKKNPLNPEKFSCSTVIG
jgi:hypothetical protein